METFVLISSSSSAPASWPAQSDSEEEDNGKITDYDPHHRTGCNTITLHSTTHTSPPPPK